MAMASILATDLTRCCICYTSAIASASSSLPTRSRLISAEKKQKKTKKQLLNSGKLLQSVSKEWRWKNNPDPLVVAAAAAAAASGSPLHEGGVARRSSTREETSVSSEVETSSNDVQASAVRGVLFDMDGVLCDSEHCSREAGVALFAEMSISVTAEDFVPFMGTGEANFLGGVAKKYGVKDFDPVSAKQRFFQIYIDKYAKPNSGLGYPGALDLILQCKAAGLKLAVASSADRIKVDANLAAAGLPQSNFDAIVAADLFKNLKPSPDIFFAAAKGLGLPPKECVVIEDALAGVQAATAAGMRCIAVTTTLSEDKLMQAGPALVRKDISHISLNDILELDQDEGAGSKFSGNGNNEVEESSNNLQALFNVEIPLPGGYSTTRRDMLKLGSLVIGLGSSYFALTHMKAMSYASPKALLNALLGVGRPPLASGSEMTRAQRIREFKQYISQLESRGTGQQVPEFQRRLEWLNTPPLQLKKDLQGKVVLLDFWTYCCINCMHVLPDLAYLESKYKQQPLTVVGVHSAKFDNEKDLGAIRNAVLRYDVTHPVVNDGDMTMWRQLGVSSWPTIALVSPKGKLITMLSGEGHRQDLDDLVEAALEYYGEKKQLDPQPLTQTLEKDKDSRLVNSPLKFPGKLATDLVNGRLFISDSNHHRIVVTDLDGNFLLQVGGGGEEGLTDGSFEKATFNRPQGVAYNPVKNVLYVADTENHALREIDFVKETVQTLAGNGTKGADYKGGKKGTSQVLNSPWDLSLDLDNQALYIAMAGQHQVWRHKISEGITEAFSGDGYERNLNGRRGSDSSFAQPSGLSLAAEIHSLYLADSESSSIRRVDLTTGGSKLLAGGDPTFADNLFQFGDKDGVGSKAQLQHPLGLLYAPDGLVYVADSYNHKIKVLEPSSQKLSTLAGTGTAGFKDGLAQSAQLSEPAGIALGLDGKLYVADTNNSVIRILDLMGQNGGPTMTTLALKGVQPPVQAASGTPRRLRKRLSSDTQIIRIDPITAASGDLQLQISLPSGFHFTTEATSKYEVDLETDGVMVEPATGALGPGGNATLHFTRDANQSSTVTTRVSCKVYYCEEDQVCLYKALVFEIPFSTPAPEVSSASVPLSFMVQPQFVKGVSRLRFRGEKTVDALVEWAATSLLKLPPILYYGAKGLVKVIMFSNTSERAAPYIQQAAKQYWDYAIFAMVLWQEPNNTFWETMLVGVKSVPVVVFVKDPGLEPVIYHGMNCLPSFPLLIL